MSLDYCTVANNYALNGGGIYGFMSGASMNITNSVITENVAESCGGGVWVDAGLDYLQPDIYPIFSHCLITNNSSGGDAGGLFIGWHMEPTITNCTIVQNGAAGIGAALWNPLGSAAITNSIIEGNTGTNIIELDYDPWEECGITYCDFYNNTGDLIGGDIPEEFTQIAMTNANGDSCDVFSNIFINPRFVNPAESAGDPFTDPDPDGTLADMGAFFFEQ
jgi:hypothetical protein